MEFSIGAVANKIIVAIICISALIAVGGAVFFHASAAFSLEEAVPFGVGVAMAMCANIAKILLLKRAIIKVTDINSTPNAKVHFQVQYFLRLMLTAGVLLLAALLPDSVASLLGAEIGIFAHPLAMHIIRFFIPTDALMSPDKPVQSGQDSVDNIKSIRNGGE